MVFVFLSFFLSIFPMEMMGKWKWKCYVLAQKGVDWLSKQISVEKKQELEERIKEGIL